MELEANTNNVSLPEGMSLTENGALQFESSLSACVDFFFQAGSLEIIDPNVRATGAYVVSQRDHIVTMLEAAYEESPIVALLLAYWLRDPRLGTGRKDLGRMALAAYFATTPQVATYENVQALARHGYWKDLAYFIEWPNMPATVVQTMLDVWADAISAGLRDTATQEQRSIAGLAAKWAPRERSQFHNTAKLLRNTLGITNKEYRKVIKNLSRTVEQQMAADEWSEINFSSVPTRAGMKYRAAFARHQPERWKEFLEDETQSANASVVWPHEIAALTGVTPNPISVPTVTDDILLARKLWANLPNFIGSNMSILPMIDLSGSMLVNIQPGITAMEVAVSLGLYCSERQHGAFKNRFLSFSDNPTMSSFEGSTLEEALCSGYRGEVGYTTDFERAYTSLLDFAKGFSVPDADMPDMLLVLSDMQFNQCSRGFAYRDGPSVLHFDRIKQLYAQHGYTMPKMVFWNLDGQSRGGTPTTAEENGVALVSGFSPKLMQAVMSDNLVSFSPRAIMAEALSEFNDVNIGVVAHEGPKHFRRDVIPGFSPPDDMPEATYYRELDRVRSVVNT